MFIFSYKPLICLLFLPHCSTLSYFGTFSFYIVSYLLYPSLSFSIRLHSSLSVYILLYSSSSFSIRLHSSLSVLILLYPSSSFSIRPPLSVYILLYPSTSFSIRLHPSLSVFILLYPSSSFCICLHLTQPYSIILFPCYPYKNFSILLFLYRLSLQFIPFYFRLSHMSVKLSRKRQLYLSFNS